MMSATRVAFVGKGGAGKSTISGTFARLLARSGRRVLAVDSDPLPGMPYALGIPIDEGVIPDDCVVEGPDGGPRWVLRPDLDAQTVIEQHAAKGPDGVRYLQFGNLRDHISSLQKSQHGWSQVIRELDENAAPMRWDLVGDLPGGTRQAMAGWAKYADTVCVVVEPSTKSLHSARRLLNLSMATWAPRSVVLVANKVVDDDDVEFIEERLEHAVIGAVPSEAAILAGDRLAQAPLDASPDGGFVMAVRALVERVCDMNYPDHDETREGVDT